MDKKIPLRMCIACREMKPKTELIRIVREADGTLLRIGSEFHEGRSAYLCKSLPCILKAEKIRALERAFRTKVEDDFYTSLKEGVPHA